MTVTNNLLIMGPPGAGKGTQAVILARELSLAHLSTGDILRREITTGSALGQQAKTFMDKGALVPDDVMGPMVVEHLVKASKAGGFILDGYPRTVVQAEHLEKLMGEHRIPVTSVLNVDVPRETVIERLSNRQTCPNPKCQAVFHKINNPPKTANRCDRCETELVVRKDDTQEVVAHRIDVYLKQTAPVLDFYRARSLLQTFDGQGAIEGITQAILAKLQKAAA